MNCQRVEERLSEYSAGELRAEEHQAVRLHLAQCQPCERLRVRLEKTWDLLGAWDGLEPGPTFQAGVWEKVRTAPRPGFAWGWVVRWGLVAASLVMVMGLWYQRPVAVAPVATVVSVDQELAELAPQLDPTAEMPELDPALDEQDQPIELGSLSDSWLDGAHTSLEKEL